MELGMLAAGFKSATFFTCTGSNMLAAFVDDGGGLIPLGALGSLPGSLSHTVSFCWSLTTFISGSLKISFTS
jgi:hypothetical protein